MDAERSHLTIETRTMTRNYLIANAVIPPSMDAEKLRLTVETRLITRNYLIANVVLPLSSEAKESYPTIETMRDAPCNLCEHAVVPSSIASSLSLLTKEMPGSFLPYANANRAFLFQPSITWLCSALHSSTNALTGTHPYATIQR